MMTLLVTQSRTHWHSVTPLSSGTSSGRMLNSTKWAGKLDYSQKHKCPHWSYSNLLTPKISLWFSPLAVSHFPIDHLWEFVFISEWNTGWMYQVSWPISWFVKQFLDAVCSVCFPDRSYCYGIPIDNLSLDFYCFTFQRWVKWAARTEKKREKENEKETQDIWGWVLRGNWTVIDILADFLPKKVSLTLISQRRLSFSR